MPDSSRRPQSDDRRAQIVEAALALLGDTPLEAVTTREIARKLEISQPALFRHFRSRDALLIAVVEHTRAALASIATRMIEKHDAVLDQLHALARELTAYVQRYPGVPRLIFSSALPSEAKNSAVRRAIAQLVSMQSTLVYELVRAGQSAGAIDAAIDARHAATLFVGMLQGAVLQWQLADRPEGLSGEADGLLVLWLDGVRPRPASDRTAAPPPASTASSAAPGGGAVAEEDGIRVLDVRPTLGEGVDPLSMILSTLSSMAAGELLIIVAPFHPKPLVALLSKQRHTVVVEAQDEERFRVAVVIDGAPAIEDLRQLEAPEPLERVLQATAALEPGATFIARLPRVPRLLLPHLDERGLRHAVYEEHDGSALLHVRARSAR